MCFHLRQLRPQSVSGQHSEVPGEDQTVALRSRGDFRCFGPVFGDRVFPRPRCRNRYPAHRPNAGGRPGKFSAQWPGLDSLGALLFEPPILGKPKLRSLGQGVGQRRPRLPGHNQEKLLVGHQVDRPALGNVALTRYQIIRQAQPRLRFQPFRAKGVARFRLGSIGRRDPLQNALASWATRQ